MEKIDCITNSTTSLQEHNKCQKYKIVQEIGKGSYGSVYKIVANPNYE